MTAADLLPRQRGSWPAFWHARLQQTTHTHTRLSAFELQASPRVAAHSSRLNHVTGDGWVAVGDAAMAFDPLSSQGLTQALASGIRAGEALDGCLAGEVVALDEYDHKANEVVRAYSQLRGVYFGREQLWPQSFFWRRWQMIVQDPEPLVGVPIGRVGQQPGKQETYVAVGVCR